MQKIVWKTSRYISSVILLTIAVVATIFSLSFAYGSSLKEYHVLLDRPVKESSDLSWKSSSKKLYDVDSIDEPAIIVLEFPDGSTLKTYSKISIFDQDKGIIWSADLSPSKEGNSSFDGAVKDFENIIDSIRLQDRSKLHSFREHLIEYSKKLSSKNIVSRTKIFTAKLSNDYKAEISIKPTALEKEQSLWYVAMTVFKSSTQKK